MADGDGRYVLTMAEQVLAQGDTLNTEGLMQVLADELAVTTRIRSNSVNPGPVKTYMRLQAYPAEDRSLLSEPSKIVAPYLYLLGPDSTGVNGQAFDCQ